MCLMNVYIQASSDCWYYFGFEDNRLSIYSSNSAFVDIIASKSNINKAGFGEYAFVDADLPDVLKFVDRFRLDYLGIKEPYEIRMPVEAVTEIPDVLQIPIDNSEDEGQEPTEIGDNAQDDNQAPAEAEDSTETTGKKKRTKQAKPQTEEDLLKPVEDKATKKEDDDEGF